MRDTADLLAAHRRTNAIVDAALKSAAEILAPPEPDPAAVLAPRELPAILPAKLVDAACQGAISRRSRRAAAHRRHRAKVGKILEAKARACRRAGQPLDAPDVVA